MSKLTLLLLAAFGLSSCTSLNQAGRAYFFDTKDIKGVESPEAVRIRLDQDRKLREIMHGNIKAARILQCTLLRNQLYVAQLHGASSNDGKMLQEAAMLMEQAYQLDDRSFLAACDQVIQTTVGRMFMGIQQEYLGKYH